MRITLCLNCLDTGASAVRVGPTRGTQYDPTYDTVDLCSLCKHDLIAGDFGNLARRNKTERTINVGAQGER